MLRLRWYKTIEDRLSCLALALNQDENLILAAPTPGGPESPKALFNEAAMGTNWSSVTCSAYYSHSAGVRSWDWMQHVFTLPA